MYLFHGVNNIKLELFTKEPVETPIGDIVGFNSIFTYRKMITSQVFYISSAEAYDIRVNGGIIPYKEEYG